MCTGKIIDLCCHTLIFLFLHIKALWRLLVCPRLTLQAADCPANAEGGPSCSCTTGFVGTLVWGRGAWMGQCTGEYFLFLQ
jgi:hypothetical protein